MAVCEGKYNFTLVDIRDTGRQNNDSVYANNLLVSAVENGLFNIPQPSKLPQSEGILPHVFAGDGTFGFKNHVMKPYPFHHVPLTEYLIIGHQEQEESLKMSLGLVQVVSLSSIDQLSLYKKNDSQTYYSDIDNKGHSSAAQFSHVIKLE